jgi:hypothetical protein
MSADVGPNRVSQLNQLSRIPDDDRLALRLEDAELFPVTKPAPGKDGVTDHLSQLPAK